MKLAYKIATALATITTTLVMSAHAETVVSVTQTSYNYKNQPVCTAQRMNPAVYGSLPSDACTLGTAGADGPDRITKNTYDAAGQLTEVDQAYGTPVQRAYARYWYNPNGTVLYQVDARTYTTQYSYDGFDRLLRTYYPCPATQNCANGNDYEEYGYDAANNRTSWRRRDGNTILYTYDNLNREIVKDMPGGTAEDVYTAYDGLGHINYKRFTSGAGVTYYYDGLGRVSAVADMNSHSIWYGYNADSTRSYMLYSDTSAQYYTYNNAGALGWTGIGGGSVGIQPIYNSLGQVLDLGGNNGGHSYYSYDGVRRLASMTQDLAGTAYDVTWSFTGRNAANQITKWGASSTLYDYKQLAAATTNNTYDGLNRDAGIAALSGGYDARGNMTFDSVRTMTYDLENRLKTVSAPGISLQLDYDPEGRLSKLTSSGAVTTFAYDGVNLIAEYDGAGNMTKRYMHTLGTDQPWVEFSGSAVGTGNATYLYANYQGSIIATADMSGNLTNLYKYGPYGEPKDGNNVDSWSGERFRYTGQIMIPEAKLYYYKARVYDPIAGRFLQTDPIGSKDDLDLYAYTHDDPINRTDPTGNDDSTNYYQLGWEWATGTGPREHHFDGNDPATKLLEKHDWIQGVGKTISDGNFKVGETVRHDFSLAGTSGVGEYAKQYASIPTNGAVGDLAVGYLGSYNMTYKVTGVDQNGVASVDFHVSNTSSMSSATHPPILGYTNFWRNNVEPTLNDAFKSGPFSNTKQTFDWTEKIQIHKKDED